MLSIHPQFRADLLYIAGILLTLSTAGCSIAYDMMENGRISACESLRGQERTECLDSATMPYEEYEQEREKALEQEL